MYLIFVFLLFAYMPLSYAQNSSDVTENLLNEFNPSTLTKEEQKKEFEWFAKAALPFKGKTIHVVSETLNTHLYERDVIAPLFEELTGIHVIFEVTGEDDVVNKINAQMELPKLAMYSAFVNDSDFIGLHARSSRTVNLTTFMKESGRDVTLPTLDLNDFIGIEFVKGFDGSIYQLPDQQFANLYWYRKDWFDRPELKKKFKSIYGYNLDVPKNWSAYEDIANFFTNDVKEIDGKRVYGHLDYSGYEGLPSLGWRFSDSWFGLAGVSDKGLPSGNPVDDWGIRTENCVSVGASVERGGATNSPAAVYAVNTYKNWLKKFSPPEAMKFDFNRSGEYLANSPNIAQQAFFYLAFVSNLTAPNSPLMNKDGTPKWRVAPSPHGAYWKPGMKLGYQDVGSWTFLKNTPLNEMKAAWLFAQFTVSKSVSLKKTLVGLTPIRESDIQSEAISKEAARLGGLVEFYRSPARIMWTPTELNVPSYGTMASFWYKRIAPTIEEKVPTQIALDGLASDFDNEFDEISKDKTFIRCAPKLNSRKKVSFWLSSEHAPFKKIENEKPLGETWTYDESLNQFYPPSKEK